MNNHLEDRIDTYRLPMRAQYKRRRPPRKQNNFPKFLLVLALLTAGLFYFLNQQLESEIASTPKNSHTPPLDLNINFSPKTQNILLMGIDISTNSGNPFKGNRSDTMLLVSIAPLGKNINVISIPRDSKVYLAGKNKTDKINHAFAYGGARLAVKTVEETFGVRINNYLAISNSGVIKAIDILGGLPIYIDKNMKYDDYSAGLHINLKQGNQVLNGKQTEGYLRFRHDNFGDIGRIKRQQWFFNALLAKLKDPAAIVKLPELLKILPNYIQTDLSGYELAKYVGIAKNVDISTIQIATIPGAPSTKGVISYWIVDPEKTQDLMNKMVYRTKTTVEPKDLSIGILYTNSRKERANAIRSELEARGADVKMQLSDTAIKDYIAIHNLNVAGDTIAELKKIVPQIKNKHTVYDPVGANRAGRDLTIIISDL